MGGCEGGEGSLGSDLRTPYNTQHAAHVSHMTYPWPTMVVGGKVKSSFIFTVDWTSPFTPACDQTTATYMTGDHTSIPPTACPQGVPSTPPAVCPSHAHQNMLQMSRRDSSCQPARNTSLSHPHTSSLSPSLWVPAQLFC